jgi:NAD(P)-dependent dehydrogenase (short-subunit alcohol dehydrogenase family)
MQLRDRIAIVTGGGKGIGRAIALGFAAEGAHLVLAARSEESLQRTAGEIQAHGGEALPVVCDVSSETQVNKMVSQTLDRFGRIDILVNNAAVFAALYPLKDFAEISVAQWDKVMAVNLRGTFLCCRAVVPHMREQRYGRIVNVSSSVFWRGIPGFLHYSTSKAGIIGLTRSLSHELGEDGITINSVAPGYTQSEGVIEVQEAGIGQDPEEIAAAQAIPRPQRPEDLVGTFVFLASDASAFITGQTIVVDGGLAMH